jgi:hypothetical protein
MAAIGNIISIWTYVDQEMGCIFGHLLGNQSEAAIQVFMTLRKSGNQIENLGVAAQYSLPPLAKEAFTALLTLYKRFESERNDLAHGCFGILDERDDILLWTAVKHMVHFLSDNALRERSVQHRQDRHELLKDNLFVYRLADLERLYEQMKNLWSAAWNIDAYLRNPDEPHRHKQLDDCNKLPIIKTEIANLKSQGKL